MLWYKHMIKDFILFFSIMKTTVLLQVEFLEHLHIFPNTSAYIIFNI